MNMQPFNQTTSFIRYKMLFTHSTNIFEYLRHAKQYTSHLEYLNQKTKSYCCVDFQQRKNKKTVVNNKEENSVKFDMIGILRRSVKQNRKDLEYQSSV